MINLYADIALFILAMAMVVFLFTYVGGSPWWATRLGQIYAIKTTLLTLVLMQNALSVLSDQDYPGREFVRLTIYVGGVFAMIALWFMLRKSQREGKAQRAAHGDHRSWRRVWGDSLRHWAGKP